MIAKISSPSRLTAALGYNFKKVEKHEASVLLVQGLFQDRNGRYSRAQVLADMLRTIPAQCRTKKTVFHCSLNPHPDEKLSDEALSRIAAEYMEALGYGAQPYIVFRHNDIPRAHSTLSRCAWTARGRRSTTVSNGGAANESRTLWRRSSASPPVATAKRRRAFLPNRQLSTFLFSIGFSEG